jgi:hypothetical protein
MIIFVGVSLVMVAVIYGVQDAFLWESGFKKFASNRDLLPSCTSTAAVSARTRRCHPRR